MKKLASDYLVYDESTGKYHEDPEQAVRDDVEKHHWLNVARTVLKDWRLYLMLVPMLLVFLFWRYFPMYELLGAFKVEDSTLDVANQLYSGFSNLKTLFSGETPLSIQFWRAFRNTFLLSFYGLCFGFPMPIIIALFFNEIKSNIARSIYQVATYLPKFMSTVVMTSLITMLVRKASPIAGMEMGVISQMLVAIGAITPEVGNAGLLFQPEFFRAIYQWYMGNRRLRLYRILRGYNRYLSHKLRGSADRRRRQDGSDEIRCTSLHSFYNSNYAYHPYRLAS